MISPNHPHEDRFGWEVHVESHRRMRGDENNPINFAELSLAERLGRGAMLAYVTLPEEVAKIREELTLFQSKLDLSGLAEDR